MNETILSIDKLNVAFRIHKSNVTVLRDVSFSLHRGQTLAIVGESGSGKSVASLAIMGLLPRNGFISGGSIKYRTRDRRNYQIESSDEAKLRQLRGTEIAMIFQEPMSSLNPLFSIGDQIDEMLVLHSDLDKSARTKRVIEMLEMVEIPAASTRLKTYPHELSGGMRQRIMIAQSLVCNPALLIADEPTTALDVTIQAQILDLMQRLQKELFMSILFITHDMGVVAEMADDVAVMYAGTIVEQADAKTLFASTKHPYTSGLLASIPNAKRAERERLVPIPGTVPPMHLMPNGCAFAPRCSRAINDCEKPIPLSVIDNNHRVACINPIGDQHG